jgi:hypothetical protein
MTHDQAVLDLHNTASGRCFLLGNGPSLRERPDCLALLKDEATFCCNTFPMWDPLPFIPKYYGVTDIDEEEHLADRVWPHLDMTRFHVGWNGPEDVGADILGRGYPHNDAFLWVQKAPEHHQINTTGFMGLGNELPPLPTGRSTPITLAQLAAWIGYREFYFLGMEQTRGYAHDPNARYSGSGLIEDFPLDKSPRYQMAVQRTAERMRRDVEAVGGHVYDCSTLGLLNATGRLFKRPGIEWKEVWEYKPIEDVLHAVG